MRLRWIDVATLVFVAVVAFGVCGPSPGRGLQDASHRAREVGAEVRANAPEGTTDNPRADRVVHELRANLDPEQIGNVLMFIPLGLYIPLRWTRLRWWTIPIGVLLSAGIEITQLLFLSWRTPSIADVLWNGLGVTIGFSLWLCGYWLLTAWRQARVLGRLAGGRHRPWLGDDEVRRLG